MSEKPLTLNDIKQPCNGCDHTMVFGYWWEESESREKKVPLDTSTPVYRMVSIEGGKLKVERDRGALASHFKTCSVPERFNFKKGKEPSPSYEPCVDDPVLVQVGPFKGIRGKVVRKGVIGKNADCAHFLGWWIQVTDGDGHPCGLFMANAAQLRPLADGAAIADEGPSKGEEHESRP